MFDYSKNSNIPGTIIRDIFRNFKDEINHKIKNEDYTSKQ